MRASPERVFEAWTRPEFLRQWWGPANVTCPEAEVDLRVGGRYRIANQFPDGKVLWIEGEFEVVQPPNKLIYSWLIGENPSHERVTVTFEPREAGATEVVIVHERITDAAARDRHEHGWLGCLDGLGELLSVTRSVAAT
jgi:uncharacterized protein YndB with AHSA1/START domain